MDVMVHTNAYWICVLDNRRSTFRYFTIVRDNLVTWKSKKQKTYN